FAIILPSGQSESGEAVVLFCVSLGFVVVHLFHLSLIRTSL
ncbi:hypothetical protein MNBD_ALPHA04-1732, partial [hydrothermal vent metagenome]